MSLDRLQSKPGNFSVQPEPSYTVASSLSSVASNQLPGGFNVGSAFAVLGASTGSLGGGGHVVNFPAIKTMAASTSMISHDNAGLVIVNMSAGGLHQLQPANYHGQVLSILNAANVSASIGSLFNTASGNGTLSTTTATVLGCLGVTFGSSGGASNAKILVARSDLGGTVGTNTAYVWFPFAAGA